jgi:hypothetical protein
MLSALMGLFLAFVTDALSGCCLRRQIDLASPRFI